MTLRLHNPGPPDDPDELDARIDRLYRYAMAVCHNRALAEDAVQDVLLKVCRDHQTWEPAYLMAAVRNRLIDVMRSESRRSNRERSLVPASPPTCHPADTGVDDAMQNALAALRPEEREALFLSVVEDYSAAEIAGLVGKPRGTVLSLLHRSKAKLRDQLAPPSRATLHGR
ncbi:MAG: RNA polymerase sigma factor [Planctomycetota bacterium]